MPADPLPAPMSREEIVDAVEALAESPRRAYVEQILAHDAALRAALARGELAGDALDAKLDALAPHGTCGCSYDRPGDVCLHHSPKLVAAEARVARLEAALVEMAIPCEAILADAPSRKWIAPTIWAHIERAVKTARAFVATVSPGLQSQKGGHMQEPTQPRLSPEAYAQLEFDAHEDRMREVEAGALSVGGRLDLANAIRTYVNELRAARARAEAERDEARRMYHAGVEESHKANRETLEVARQHSAARMEAEARAARLEAQWAADIEGAFREGFLTGLRSPEITTDAAWAESAARALAPRPAPTTEGQ